jgi:nicotinate-nucleotide adenylyltransferase
MKIGLFGGTFDPVHMGHLIVAETVRSDCGLDRILFIPTGIQPRKTEKPAADPETRLRMIELAAAGHDAMGVSDVEIKREGVSYTLDTLKAMNGIPSGRGQELFLVMGMDSLIDFQNWKEPHEILKRAGLLVAARPGFDRAAVEPWIQNRAVFVETPRVDISSTEIRRRIREGLSVRFWVPEPVLAYIRGRGLYC